MSQLSRPGPSSKVSATRFPVSAPLLTPAVAGTFAAKGPIPHARRSTAAAASAPIEALAAALRAARSTALSVDIGAAVPDSAGRSA